MQNQIWCVDEYSDDDQNSENSLNRERQRKEAIRSYSNLYPNDLTTLIEKGQSLFDMGEFEEAAKCYDEAIHLNPNDPITFNQKGISLYNLQKYDEAIECYDEAIRLNPNYPIVFSNKGTKDQLTYYRIDTKQFIEI